MPVSSNATTLCTTVDMKKATNESSALIQSTRNSRSASAEKVPATPSPSANGADRGDRVLLHLEVAHAELPDRGLEARHVRRREVRLEIALRFPALEQVDARGICEVGR